MLVLTICGSKGGVGKTSLCANLAGIVSEWGWDVLLIDTDPQASLSNYFPITQYAEFGVTRLFSHVDISRSISKTALQRLDIVHSDDPTDACERLLHTLPDRLNRIKFSLIELSDYDLVIIDTKGSVNAVLEAALAASDQILSPIVPDMLSAREFIRGTMGTILKLQKCFAINHQLMAGVLYRTRKTIDASLIYQQIYSLYDSSNVLNFLSTSVPDRVVYREAATAQEPVHRFERYRRNGCSANETMTALALEVWPDLKKIYKTAS